MDQNPSRGKLKGLCVMCGNTSRDETQGLRPAEEISAMDFFCLCWRGIVHACRLKPAGKRLPTFMVLEGDSQSRTAEV